MSCADWGMAEESPDELPRLADLAAATTLSIAGAYAVFRECMSTPKRRGRPARTGHTQDALAAARRALDDAGISVAEWSRANGFERATVVDVLLGRRAGHHGEAHQVAVALGLKAGRTQVVAKGFKPLQSPGPQP